ncbi:MULTISPECIES: dephospho-CoA kinase [unclassified Rhizobium]|uniref:dephospho-CoA kinase n=1 Tax=unclassified Rhizobium TaxID=2613769 RepID=UPI0006F71D10|nr:MULTISPECIES: dephospho-CoA kinase [unclassified Rhizobium]KQV35828.1 dephospho-CoA kinase [Rhizobium sp. Root1212]KRD25935.1 dephospho-CoA kinase [Rhizobium sp. Root268]
MIMLGLTGSIGMGKSTTAQMFVDLGIPVNDADAVVHDLYQGEAVAPMENAFPGVISDGRVDRAKLSSVLAADPSRFKELEAIIHPLVRRREKQFLERHRALETPIVVLDIPLLYETGGESRVDAVVVVTADPDTQRERVLKRPGMTPEKFDLILSRQMPDAQKRAKADYIIDTGQGFDSARAQVAALIDRLLKKG